LSDDLGVGCILKQGESSCKELCLIEVGVVVNELFLIEVGVVVVIVADDAMVPFRSRSLLGGSNAEFSGVDVTEDDIDPLK